MRTNIIRVSVFQATFSAFSWTCNCYSNLSNLKFAGTVRSMVSIVGSLRVCVGLPIRCLSTCATRSNTQSTLLVSYTSGSARSYLPRSQSLRITRYCSTSALMTKLTNSGDSFRLPLDVKPTHYDLTVKTDLENSTFEGVVKIEYVHTH